MSARDSPLIAFTRSSLPSIATSWQKKRIARAALTLELDHNTGLSHVSCRRSPPHSSMDRRARARAYVKEGLIDMRLVALFGTNLIRGYWEKFGPFILEYRVRARARNLLLKQI